MIMVTYWMDRQLYSNDGHFFKLFTRVNVISNRESTKKSFGNQEEEKDMIHK